MKKVIKCFIFDMIGEISVIIMIFFISYIAQTINMIYYVMFILILLIYLSLINAYGVFKHSGIYFVAKILDKGKEKELNELLDDCKNKKRK